MMARSHVFVLVANSLVVCDNAQNRGIISRNHKSPGLGEYVVLFSENATDSTELID